MTAAFAYLIFNTTRNRLRSQLARLQSPRYAIGLMLGVLYFWSVFFRRGIRVGSGPSVFLGPTAELLAPIPLIMLIAGIWLFGGDRSALAFTEAEVSMLLTAPVSRRALIVYKLARTQIFLMLNAAIWVFILRRGSAALASVFSLISIWSLFTTVSLHRMGAALLHAKHVEQRSAGQRRNWVGILVGLTIVAVVFAQVRASTAALNAATTGTAAGTSDDPLAFVGWLAAILSQPIPHALLYPFHLVVAPIFAHNVGEWAAAIVPAIAIVVLHGVWVVRSNAAFEEAAVAASAEQATKIAALRARRSSAPPVTSAKASGTFSLASHGAPAVAIAWKNVLAMRRTLSAGAPLRLFAITLIGTAFFTVKSGQPALIVTAGAFAMMFALLITGVPTLRNDLRSDMLHLPFLKSLPVRGADLVLAEIMPAALTIAALQFALVLVAFAATALSESKVPVSLDVRIGLLAAAPFVLLAVTATLFVVANGAAILFPAWLRLGPAGAGGVEMMGQSMLGMIGALFALVLLLILPVGGGGIAYLIFRASTTAAIAASGASGAAILASESYLVIVLLGRAFERAEPQQVG